MFLDTMITVTRPLPSGLEKSGDLQFHKQKPIPSPQSRQRFHVKKPSGVAIEFYVHIGDRTVFSAAPKNNRIT